MPIASPTIRALIARTACSLPEASIRRNRIPTPDEIPPGQDSIEVPAWVQRGSFSDPIDYARARWGAADSSVARVLKSGVGALSSDSDAAAIGAVQDEFFRSYVDSTLIGRMAGLRRVPFNVRINAMTQGVRGYFVSEFAPIPMNKQTLAGSSLVRKKFAVIIAVTEETFTAANPLLEARLEQDITDALVTATDQAFIDATNSGGGTGGVPASVVYDHDLPSQGDPASDIELLIASFAGDLSQAFFVCDPVTAGQIALARDAGGAFAFSDCGPRGGSILGIPLLTSRGSPRDSSGGQLALIDASGIAGAIESVQLSRSTAATLVMSDSPAASGEAGELVSLFQTGTVAVKGVVNANWELQRTGGAVVVTGVNYSVSASS